MDRMKTFAKYAIWVILFCILSDILIYYGINTTYKTISRRNEISNQIAINDAEATKVNGRIKGAVTNTEENNISGKYIKIDLYSERGNVLGTKYLDIGNLEPNQTTQFETYFKIQDVKSYDVTISDEKVETTTDVDFMTEDMKQMRIIMLLTYMIFF